MEGVPIIKIDRGYVVALFGGKKMEVPLKNWVKYYYLSVKLIDRIKDKVFGDIYAIKARMPLVCGVKNDERTFACSTFNVLFSEYCEEFSEKLSMPKSGAVCMNLDSEKVIAVYGTYYGTYPNYTVDIRGDVYSGQADVNAGLSLEIWRLEARMVYAYLPTIFVLATKWGTVYKYKDLCATALEPIKKAAVEDLKSANKDAVVKFLLT